MGYPVETLQIVTPDGEWNESASYRIEPQSALAMYRRLLLTRMFDRKAINLQRQGRMGTYAPFEGQEAAQVGSAFALQAGDWMFPTYRDHAAMITFGHDMSTILLYWMGRIEGCIPPADRDILPPTVPIATQIPQAVGVAWAAKLRGEATVAMSYFGDGATSEGDFHEGLNFASVFRVPAIFFCQNNGYAISVPLSRQTATETIAEKAAAYNMPGVRVDGNDVFAVHHAVTEAVKRARGGEGPTLIEAITYRYGAHTTSDDPKKYRDSSEGIEWSEQRDAILRVERLLLKRGWLDEAAKAQMLAEIEQEIDEAVRVAEAIAPVRPETIFQHVLAEQPWNVAEQQEELTGLLNRLNEKNRTGNRQFAEV